MGMSTAADCSGTVSPGQAPLPTAEQLPDDPETLKQMVVELVLTVRQRDHDLGAARQRIHLLLQRLYGRRSERCNPDQPLLFADIDTASASPAEPSVTPDQPAEEPHSQPKTSKRPRHKHGRRRLPDKHAGQEPGPPTRDDRQGAVLDLLWRPRSSVQRLRLHAQSQA